MSSGWYALEDYLRSGGVVMVPLVLVSLLMWGMILYCLLTLKSLYSRNVSREQAGEWVRHGSIPLSHGYCGVSTQLVSLFMLKRSGDPALDIYVMDEAVLAVGNRLERGLTMIGVLAAIAPLLGLLGTVLGMIGTFDTIAIFGTGNARAMAGGISQALITTQTGLLIAIPGLYMRNFLQRRAGNLKQRVISLGIYLKRHLAPLPQEAK
ncbi:MAG: MotA/TolQ/ExbB proton channel family protein [Thermodesulfobacteriota bacterium]|nr:MotA/TolQ/ExbB proton channel family protein [Thermodesulfobacteriota bacterium]